MFQFKKKFQIGKLFYLLFYSSSSDHLLCVSFAVINVAEIVKVLEIELLLVKNVKKLSVKKVIDFVKIILCFQKFKIYFFMIFK